MNGITKRRRKPKASAPAQQELSHVPVLAADIHPSPENDRIYGPVNPADPAIVRLAASIGNLGLREPLVITRDQFIISGHRRHCAATLAGLKYLPCRIEPFNRADDPDRFEALLVAHNDQRVKTRAERLREEIVLANPEAAHHHLQQFREQEARVDLPAFKIVGSKSRCQITDAKAPMMAAIKQVLEERREFWPLSDRSIHYGLLNHPPRIHARKPNSIYRNDHRSYKALVELLTRARLAGLIPMNAIDDATRPVTTWNNCFREPGAYLQEEMRTFLKSYFRDLMQSQPNHIEIIVEKNTVEPIIRPLAMEYTIPITSGRGYCSLPPRAQIAKRYHESGKEKLVLLLISDHDPDGDEIAHSLARSMRDDFGIQNIHPIKAALTPAQIAKYELPPMMKAKKTSAQYRKFNKKHGDNVFELEALSPSDLQAVVREAIDNVLDLDAYNAEIAAERKDAAFLAGVRKTMLNLLKDADLDGLELSDED